MKSCELEDVLKKKAMKLRGGWGGKTLAWKPCVHVEKSLACPPNRRSQTPSLPSSSSRRYVGYAVKCAGHPTFLPVAKFLLVACSTVTGD